MHGASRHATYYRCRARTLVPGSPAAAEHPAQVYLREDQVLRSVNAWIGSLFAEPNRATTIETLLGADDTGELERGRVAALRRRISEATATMSRLQRALDAGWDPEELRSQYNVAAAQKREAETELSTVAPEPALSRDRIVALVDEIGDVARLLDEVEPSDLARLYQSLSLSMVYHHHERAVDVAIDPVARCGPSERVRGGTHNLTPPALTARLQVEPGN